MANITAGMVKELREKTGAGMMDCKAALNETDGDMEAAVDWLRKKGLAKAAKKAGRVAAEGLIGVAVDGTKGVVVEVNSETDFVARNDLFQGLVKMIADVALDAGDRCRDSSWRAKVGGRTVAEAIATTDRQDRREHDAAPRRRALGRQRRDRQLRAQFGHRRPRQDRRAGRARIAWQGRRARGVRPHGRDACRGRQSAGARSVRARSGDHRAREGRARRKAKAEGKPANVVEKIVESGLKTFYKEVCLLEQALRHEDRQEAVAQAIKEAEGKVGGPIKVTGFVRYALGEGIDRPEGDFGGEVAALAGAN